MIIKSLKLKNYRNYELLNMAFDSRTNILYGDNAQGKTNILEALYLSGTTKSHRGTKDRDMIRFGEEESHIETIVEKNGVDFQIDMHLKKNSPMYSIYRPCSSPFGVMAAINTRSSSSLRVRVT